MVNYFFDTYALVELIKKNPRFMPYGEYPLVTTILNKIELYWWALNYNGRELADITLNSLENVQDISDEVIESAMLFRKENKKKDISYADAIGYAFALKHNLIFLTGDRQFKELPGVEFVQ